MILSDSIAVTNVVHKQRQVGLPLASAVRSQLVIALRLHGTYSLNDVHIHLERKHLRRSDGAAQKDVPSRTSVSSRPDQPIMSSLGSEGVAVRAHLRCRSNDESSSCLGVVQCCSVDYCGEVGVVMVFKSAWLILQNPR